MATSTLILLVLGYVQLFLHTSEASRVMKLDARAATPMITAPPTASSTKNVTSSYHWASKSLNSQVAAITLKATQPSRCLQSDIPYSSKFSVPLGNFNIFADNATGWGEIGSVWNFTASDDVQLSFTTNNSMRKRIVVPSCQGPLCAARAELQQAAGPTDSFVHNADGSWYMAFLL